MATHVAACTSTRSQMVVRREKPVNCCESTSENDRVKQGRGHALTQGLLSCRRMAGVQSVRHALRHTEPEADCHKLDTGNRTATSSAFTPARSLARSPSHFQRHHSWGFLRQAQLRALLSGPETQIMEVIGAAVRSLPAVDPYSLSTRCSCQFMQVERASIWRISIFH